MSFGTGKYGKSFCYLRPVSSSSQQEQTNESREKDKLLDTLHPEKDMKEPMAEITNLASEKARLLFSV